MKRHNLRITDKIGGGGNVADQIGLPMNPQNTESKHMDSEIGAVDLKESREAVLTVLSVHRAALARILYEGARSAKEHMLVHDCLCFTLCEIENLSRMQKSAEVSPPRSPAKSRLEVAVSRDGVSSRA